MTEKKKILRADDLVPIKRQEEKRDSALAESITTVELDGDARQTRRAYLLSRATDQELNDLAGKIEARTAKEDELLFLRCPTCGLTMKARRKNIGTGCPQCAKKSFILEGEKPFEPGIMAELKGAGLRAYLKLEEKTAELQKKEIEERNEAQKILSKAGFFPSRRYDR